MAYATNSLMARIEWCRRQSTQAYEQREAEEWHAEEDGLRDAILKRDHSHQYRHGPPGAFARYLMGLQDGRAMLLVGLVEREFVASSQEQLETIFEPEAMGCPK